MFFRMIRGAFARQKKKMLMIALTIALGASLATAMLNVMMDVGNKVSQELKAYGANITVVPKSASVLEDLYEIEGEETSKTAYLREDELGKIKTIFWAFNILDYAPFIDTQVTLADGSQAKIVGSWFDHHMDLPTGETLDTGMQNLRSWWDITEGTWLDEQKEDSENGCMIGSVLASRLGVGAGDILHVETEQGSGDLKIAGVFDSGGDEDEQIYASLDTVQELSDTDGLLTSIEVSALTTPDNELAEKAATQGPESLSISQYETWYCTAYVSSICFQIQEVISDSVAAPVRQVADSEGAIMEKTQLLMILITFLALIGTQGAGFRAMFMACAGFMLLDAVWWLFGMKYLGDAGKKPFLIDNRTEDIDNADLAKDNRALTSLEKSRIVAILIVTFLSGLFWLFWYLLYMPVYYEFGPASQGGMGWANWNLGASFEMPTAWFDSMNGLLCIILAPVLASVWNNLSKKGKDLSMMTKTALGIMLLGLGVAAMSLGGIIFNNSGVPVGVWLIILTAVCMSVGEMLFSPLGNSFISEYAPKKYLGTLLGAWPFVIFFAGLAYGPLYNAMRVNFTRSFMIAAIIVFACGAAMLLFKNKFELMINGTEEQRRELAEAEK